MAAPGAAWAGLPSDILAQIVERVDSHDATCVRLACRQWRDAVASTTQHLRPRRLVPGALQAFPAVTSLDLSSCALSPGDLPLLAGGHRLRALTLQNRGEDGELLRALAALPGLTDVELVGFSGTENEVAHLWGLTRLRRLSMTAMPEASGTALQALVSLTMLTSIRLHRRETDFSPVQQVTALACSALAAALPRLRAVSLGDVCGSAPEELAALTLLQGLERLRLSRLGLGPEAVAAIACLTGLTELSLVADRRRPGRYAEEPSARDVAGLACLTRLRALTLSGCNWGPPTGALSRLSGLAALTRLDLSSPRTRRLMPDAVVLHCFPLEQLRSLALCGASCSGGLLDALPRATRLQELDLSRCSEMLAGDLHNLAGLSGLRSLRMDACDLMWPSRREDWACAAAFGRLTRLSWSECAAPPLWLLADAGGEDVPAAGALLSHARSLTSLQQLAMPQQSMCPTEKVGQQLGCLAALQELDLSGAFCPDGGDIDASLAGLARLPRLRRLCLADARLSPAAFAHIGRLTVRHLPPTQVLVFAPSGSSPIHPRGCVSQQACHACVARADRARSSPAAVRKCTLRRPRLQERAPRAAALFESCERMLQGLTWLDVSRTPLCDAGLQQLRGLTRLRALLADASSQGGCAGAGDAGLACLAASCPELERLSLRGSRGLTAAGLGPLASLTGLAYLDLREAQQPDAADMLAALQGCTALRELLVGGGDEACYPPLCAPLRVVHSAQLTAFRARLPFLLRLELGAEVVSGTGVQLLSLLQCKLRGVVLAACRTYLGVVERYQGWRPSP